MTVSMQATCLSLGLDHLQSYVNQLCFDGLSLKNAPLEIRSNPVIAELALNQNGLSLEYATLAIQNNADLVTKACINNPHAFAFASYELRQSREFILNLLMVADPVFIKYAHPFFTKERLGALDLLAQASTIYPHLDRSLTSLVSFNIEACQINTAVFSRLDRAYQSNPEFLNLLCFKDRQVHVPILEFVQSKLPLALLERIDQNPACLKEIGSPFDENMAIAYRLCKSDPSYFQEMSLELRMNEEVVKFLMEMVDPSVFIYAAENILDHDDLAIKAVLMSPTLIAHCSSRLKSGVRELSLKACQKSSLSYLLIDAKFKNDPEIAAICVIQDPLLIEQVPVEVQMIPRFWSMVLEKNVTLLALCPDAIKATKEFWIELCLLKEGHLTLCPPALINSEEFWLDLVPSSKKLLGYCPIHIFETSSFWIKLIRLDHAFLEHCPVAFLVTPGFVAQLEL